MIFSCRKIKRGGIETENQYLRHGLCGLHGSCTVLNRVICVIRTKKEVIFIEKTTSHF